MSTNYFDKLLNKVLYQNGTPEDAIEFIRFGFLKKEQKDYLGAIEEFSKSIKINPNDGNVYGFRGDAKIELGDYQGALDDYALGKHTSYDRIDFSNQILIANTKLIAQRIDSFYMNEESNMKSEAVAHLKMGKDISKSFKNRIVFYDKAIAINPNYSKAYKFRAWLKYLEQDYHGAKKDYDNAINIFKDPDVFFQRGKMKVLIHDYTEAINDFNLAMELYQGCKDNTRIYSLYLRGYSKFKLKDHFNALKDIDAALKIDNIEYFNQEGFSYGEFEYDIDDPEINNETYTTSIKDYIGTYATSLRDSISNLIKLNESIESYIRCDDTAPSKLYKDRFILKYSLKNFQGALADLNKVIELTPNDFILYEYRIDLYIKLKSYTKAISEYNLFLERHPKSDPSCYLKFERGKIKAKVHDYKGAIADINTFLERNENEEEAYYERGICNIMLGYRDLGLKDLTKAEELRYHPATIAIKKYFS